MSPSTTPFGFARETVEVAVPALEVVDAPALTDPFDVEPATEMTPDLVTLSDPFPSRAVSDTV
jgi:hypothetical protein